MRTKDEIMVVIESTDWSQQVASTPWGATMLDHRALNRLLDYLTLDEASEVLELAEDITEEEWGKVLLLDKDVVLDRMELDLKFAFEKALGERGISANLMHQVMCMYLWLLEDDEMLDRMDYHSYGVSDLYTIRDKYFPEMEEC